jgi:ribosome-binding factor A
MTRQGAKSKSSFSRMDRIIGLLKKEISKMLREEFETTETGFITVLDAEVSKDLRYAKIFISVGTPEKLDVILTQLNQEAYAFRKAIAGSLNLRMTPEIRFVNDASLHKGQRIEDLLRQARSCDAP